MTVPLDDKMVHRAFGFYETFTVRNALLYNFHDRVKSLYAYAKMLKLRPPFPEDYAKGTLQATF